MPWEYLYDHPSFLSISTWTPIVRYLDLPKPRRPLQIALPLRVLAMVSAPSGRRSDRREPGTSEAREQRSRRWSTRARSPSTGSRRRAFGRSSASSARPTTTSSTTSATAATTTTADDGVLMFEDDGGRGRRVSGVQLGDDPGRRGIAPTRRPQLVRGRSELARRPVLRASRRA